MRAYVRAWGRTERTGSADAHPNGSGLAAEPLRSRGGDGGAAVFHRLGDLTTFLGKKQAPVGARMGRSRGRPDSFAEQRRGGRGSRKILTLGVNVSKLAFGGAWLSVSSRLRVLTSTGRPQRLSPVCATRPLRAPLPGVPPALRRSSSDARPSHTSHTRAGTSRFEDSAIPLTDLFSLSPSQRAALNACLDITNFFPRKESQNNKASHCWGLLWLLMYH